MRPRLPTLQRFLVTTSEAASALSEPVLTLCKQLEAQHPGLDLWLSPCAQDAGLYLAKIVIPKSERGEGTGSKVMQAICAFADARQLIVTLTPSSDFGGSKGRLQEFYGRFGFVKNAGRHKDFRFREDMLREPKG